MARARAAVPRPAGGVEGGRARRRARGGRGRPVTAGGAVRVGERGRRAWAGAGRGVQTYGGRRRAASTATAGSVEGEGDGGRRRGRGRLRAASRARATVAGLRRGVESEKTRKGSGPCIYSPPFSRGWGGDPRLKGNL